MQEDGAPGVRAPAVRQLRAQARWAGPSVFRFEGDPVKRTPQQRRLCVASIFRVKYLPKKARGREPERRKGEAARRSPVRPLAWCRPRRRGTRRLAGPRDGPASWPPARPRGRRLLPAWPFVSPWLLDVGPGLGLPASLCASSPPPLCGGSPPPPAASTGRCSPLPARPSSLPLSEVLPVGGCAGVTGRAVSRGTGS